MFPKPDYSDKFWSTVWTSPRCAAYLRRMSDAPVIRFLNRATPPHVSTLILITGLSALAMNLFLPSLPGMADHFETDYRVMQLSVALYLGANAVLQILIGPVSDRFGRRPVILWGIALFILATLGCIYAPNATVFLMFRLCQAIIATAMVLGRAAVRDMYDTDKAASMIGYVTMGMAVVPMLGPAVGGVLDAEFGWTSNFWLLILIALLILALTWFDFGETARRSGETLREQFSHYPELLSSPRFWGYSLALTFSSGAFFAYLGGAAFVGSDVYGLESAVLGVYFGAPALGYMIGNYITGRYAGQAGVNRLALSGAVTLIAGLVLCILFVAIGYDSELTFFGFMSAIGIGNGMTIPSATSGVLSVRPHLAGTAAGLNGAIMLGGGAALSALAGWMLVPGSGVMPLLWLMMATSLLGLFSILAVIRRDHRLGN